MKTRDFTCDEEVQALVAALEAGMIPLAEFKHSAHLAVGLAYLARWPLPEATERMRRSLLGLVERHKPGAYHETLTVFWMRLLDHLARASDPGLPLWRLVNATIASHGGRGPVAEHYSDEAINSAAARAGWIEPDLRPLPAAHDSIPPQSPEASTASSRS